MYHDVIKGSGESATVSPGQGPYNLSWRTFIDHLNRYEELVSTPPSLIDEIQLNNAGPNWSLTFDDGGASALLVGKELNRRGWCGYFFITTNRIGREGFVDSSAIRELDAMGQIIGSHSVTHPIRIGSLPLPELRHEWSASVEELEDLLAKPVLTASVPGGYYGKNVALAAAEAGIATLFTSQPVRTARMVGSCLVVGRYIIRRTTTATTAAQAAAGDSRPWLRQTIGWNTRKAAKFAAGERYDRLRRRLLVGGQIV
jgi:peptidoglycan/xylan/chitin deacetylase (PgdA/CDA1 family)